MADRISTLPASVLCHILSFLPTKQAVSTSVLSKTWNPLWRSLSTLDFDFQGPNINCDLDKEKYSRFVQWVNEVILSRDLHQPIQTFRLRCFSFHCDPKNVNIWVNVALQLRVEHLDLCLSPTSILPCAILRHRTLVVLKLKVLLIPQLISSVDLPSLKILHLEEIKFLESEYLRELLSGCLVLEDLVIRYLYFTNSRPSYFFDKEFKRLPKLVRADIRHCYVPMVTYSNVEFLRLDDKGYRVNYAFGRGTFFELTYISPYAKDPVPVFHNLVHIELIYFHYTMNWLHVIEVLNHCPKLQILIIDQDFRFVGDSDEERDWRYPESAPRCISLHLKTFHLNNYKGSKGEVRFARYVMRNASILRTIKICVNAEKIRDARLNKFEMLRKLSSCTRSSPTCKLSFEIIPE